MAIAAFIATFCSALFAGAALYINLVEHPARLACGSELALQVFRPSYQRAAPVQASLALIATISGIMVWALGGSPVWLTGAGLIFAVIPFTFIVIMPTNKQLLDAELEMSSEQTQELLVKWGKLHGVRTVLSIAASGIFLYLVSSV